MTRTPAQWRASLRRAVAAGVRDWLKTSAIRSELPIHDLLDLASDLAEADLTFAIDPLLEALSAMRSDGRLPPDDLAWLENLEGLRDFSSGNLPGANRHFQAALAIPGTHDSSLLVNTHLNLANVAWFEDDAEQAVKLLLQARTLARNGSDAIQSKVLVNLAGLYIDMDRGAEADPLLRTLSKMARARGQGRLRAAVAGLLGLRAANSGRLAEARDLFATSARHARNAGAVSHEIAALQNLAAVSLDLGRTGAAIRRLRRAERLATEVQIVRALDAIQRTLATALHRAKRGVEASRVLTRARAQARSRRDPAAVARIDADTGALRLLDGLHRQAIPPLQRAYAASALLEMRGLRLQSTANLATALVRSHRFAAASRALNATIAELRPSDDEFRDLTLRHARTLLAEGSPARAAAAYWQALSRQVGSRADDLGTTAAEFLEVGASRQALEFLSAALGEFNEGTATIARYQLLNDRALAWVGLRRLDRARSDLVAALHLAGAADDRIMRITALRNLSEVERRADNLERARTLAAESVTLARDAQDRRELVEALGTLGLAEIALDQFVAARATLREAERLGRRDPDPAARAVVLGGLGAVEFGEGRYRQSRRYYEHAAELERAGDDAKHEAETMGALIEVYARLADEEPYEAALQRLIDLTQQRHTSVETMLFATSRAGGAWLRNGNMETAAETFVAGILVGLAEATKGPGAPMVKIIGRATVAPFVHARLVGVPFAEIERLMTKRLRSKLGRHTSLITDLYGPAREATADIEAAQSEPS